MEHWDKSYPEELNVVEYVKWPRLLVVGDDITPEQANEVIIRTTPLGYMFTNDKKWESIVRSAFDIPSDLTHDDYALPVDERIAKARTIWNKTDRRIAQLGILNLHNMANHRIASAYLGGPHGWCDWEGGIGTASYNVGKWPTAGEMHTDLVDIATAFPFLRMRVQLLNDRYDETVESEYGPGSYVYEDTAPVTWTVDGGAVEYVIEDRPPLRFEEDETRAPEEFFSPTRERGVSQKRLREAIAQVERRALTREDDPDGDQ
jgi:hypothetical protein